MLHVCTLGCAAQQRWRRANCPKRIRLRRAVPDAHTDYSTYPRGPVIDVMRPNTFHAPCPAVVMIRRRCRYIFGENIKQGSSEDNEKVAMTSPVRMEMQDKQPEGSCIAANARTASSLPERIAMTSPVQTTMPNGASESYKCGADVSFVCATVGASFARVDRCHGIPVRSTLAARTQAAICRLTAALCTRCNWNGCMYQPFVVHVASALHRLAQNACSTARCHHDAGSRCHAVKVRQRESASPQRC